MRLFHLGLQHFKLRFAPTAITTLLLIITNLISLTAIADERPTGIDSKLISISALDNIPGYQLAVKTVEVAPGASAPSHKHAGFVFVYVLEGTIRSQLNNEITTEFTVGESWVEPPGTVHSITHNPSATDKAKLLAVFVSKEGALLTDFGNNH